MPYGPSDKLPPSAKSYRGAAARAFKHAFNQCHAKGHEESRCFRIAHSAARGVKQKGKKARPMPYDEPSWRLWYQQVLAHRIRARRATEGTDRASLQARAVHRAFCRQSGGNGRLYLLNTFGWILEPRNDVGTKVLPFITWPRQVDLIDEEEDAKATPGPSPRANLMVIKSRDVGGTWIDVSDTSWEWLFTPMWHSMVISSNFELAADWDNPISYFYKLKFFLTHLPAWLLPEGFAGFHQRSPHAKEGILINPDKDSTFTASTTTPDAGRANRLASVKLEEAATLDDFDAIYNSLQSVTDHVKGITSAHVRHGYGPYNLVHGKEGYTAPRVFYFRWRDVPGRDEQWYRDKKATMKADEFAREVDIDWLAGSGDMAFPSIRIVEPGPYPFVPGWQVYVGIDDGYDQDTAISWWQTDLRHGRLRCIGAYANAKLPIRFYGQLLTGEPSGQFRWGETEREIIDWLRENRIHSRAIYVGDRHGDNTDLSSGKSPFGVLSEEFGLYVLTANDPESNNLKVRLDLLNAHIPLMDFDAGHGAPLVLEALKLSRHPRRRDSAQPVTEVKGVIHHGTESHFRSTVDSLLMHVRWVLMGGNSPEPVVPRVGIGGGFDPRQGRRFGTDPSPPREVIGVGGLSWTR